MLKLRVFVHKLVQVRLLALYLRINELLHGILDESFLIVVNLL
jgi:hypothetical protein